MEEYRRIADRVEAAVRDGRLRPGDRLPPQRVFARRHRIANSTAIRVYGELARRGLVVGEVGRGTFVRAAPPLPGPALAEATGAAPVDLQLNYPVAEGQSELMARALAALARPDVLAEAVSGPAAATGTPEAREAAASVLARPGWAPDPENVLFAGNGRQAIAAALSALVPPGGRLGVEALTYPLVKAVADRLGIRLVPLALDEEGVRPEALAATHRATPLAAVYLQPTLHNPLSVTAGEGRRAELAELLRRLDLTAVEDTTWAFLVPDAPAPLAAFAPERVLLVDSLSKRLAPGLTVGYLVVPARLRAAAGDALRSGAWTAGGLALAAATRWAGDGTVAEAVAAKRADTAARHALVLRHLGGHAVRTSPHAYYCWWELPAPWRAETFAAAAAERAGVAVTPGSAFAVGPGTAPDAIRVGLASPTRAVLDGALGRLAALAGGGA
ncbi:PLP-dependent aminotransferase family protein [Streptomyces sp. WAC01280]|uniref:aminotransferase-like domain-containing protein n=1 Tax=Streptomyces sp. WAC01280 TaxID=2487424 RepID=UPI000F7BA133|nr:PLP-dependent aminotransferase family protein [Streptomyces sp. WAC01280]RSS54044.1 PLP-dependent aminotransferase family protein [Streptomyces sp. WAC01280]